MLSFGGTGFIIIIINVIFSYQGFKNADFKEKYLFSIEGILGRKEYIRMISSGFLHADWIHLMFNMLSLYFFSASLEYTIGTFGFLAVYFASLIAGNLLSLFLHKNNGMYRALGASGAVSGVIFGAVAVIPGDSVRLFGLFSITGWLYALLYVGGSIYGIRKQSGNIGHDAHLGGAIAGMLMSILIIPEMIFDNTLPIIAALVPSLLFFIVLWLRPDLLNVGPINPINKSNPLKKKGRLNYQEQDELFYLKKQKEQEELDFLLDKISKKGYDNLSAKEKQRLKDLS